MYKNLPIKINGKGFTLVELMVVIAIIAILAIVGITIFTGTQRTARDARRRSDVEAIAKAVEQHFNNTQNQQCSGAQGGSVGTYCQGQPNWFAGNDIPFDPSGTNRVYCFYHTIVAAPAPAANPGAVPNPPTTCPNVAGYTGTAITGATTTLGVANMTAWKVCAFLETTGASVADQIVCQGSQQQ